MKYTSKFWNILISLYKLKNKERVTAIDMSVKCGFNLRDGFFYKEVLPVLLDNGILRIDEGYVEKRGYLGRTANIFIFDKYKLDEFFVKNHPIVRFFYLRFVNDDIDIDIDV